MMGGYGSGGMRPGSGPKGKTAARKALEGSRGGRRAAAAVRVELIPPPADLHPEQAAVWNELAPYACEERTLTRQTVRAFRDLCEAIVVKRAMLAKIQEDGLTYVKVTVDGSGNEHSELKAHPLLSQHRGMMQRVEAGMLRFRIAPDGKVVSAPVQEADPFDEFDGESVQ